MKVRQDAWTEEDDLLLAETVLRHVREGSTQLNAFEEVGDQLNRTSAACGFRWNAVVRYNFDKALQLAKKHRKEKMRAANGDQAKKKLLYTPPASFSVSLPEEVEQELEGEALPIPMQVNMNVSAPSSSISMNDVITFLQTLDYSDVKATTLERENERLKKELTEYVRHNEELQAKIQQMEHQSSTIQEDYETILKIMNRARKIALTEEEERTSTSFRMDRNGNLEKIAE
ncbi:RsfA family transcriptional regulator [Ectobacillus polymachus]|uniref:RsfA family transcriptional regulator n=1 Tax=Ectobacillus polymachus TaxID=1508806 RepID=UPI003A86499A